jgi:hypothetical protein
MYGKPSDLKKGSSEPGLPPDVKAEIQDLEYAMRLLRIKMQSAGNLADKLGLYNEIRTLQANIDRLREEHPHKP